MPVNPAAHIPTVVVHTTDGGILEAVCADTEIRVILVDYLPGYTENQVLAPDGNFASIWAEQLQPNPVHVAEFLTAAELPLTAESRVSAQPETAADTPDPEFPHHFTLITDLGELIHLGGGWDGLDALLNKKLAEADLPEAETTRMEGVSIENGVISIDFAYCTDGANSDEEDDEENTDNE